MRKILSSWWAGLAFWLAVGGLTSVALTCLVSLYLMGLPHGWDTATSWDDVRMRFSWIAFVLLPTAATVHLVVWLCTRDRSRAPGAAGARPAPSRRPGGSAPAPRAAEGRPPSYRRGGRHR
ncbi:hypothetical protein ACIRPX_09870 [Streptomyces sp. NPDC101225]|uniref:hypothetical protein n=1 Tax=Streptomyces sp. NPDC101225 TaxID=3366135 RepID=UPI00380BA580